MQRSLMDECVVIVLQVMMLVVLCNSLKRVCNGYRTEVHGRCGEWGSLSRHR